MFQSSEDAMEAAIPVSIARARAELRSHGCRIIGERCLNEIQVTNDCDAPEWIGCDTRSILEWLGY